MIKQRKLKRLCALLLITTIILMQSILFQNSIVVTAASKGYLVLIEEKDGTFTSYENCVETVSGDKLMIKVASLSKAIGIQYKKSNSKQFSVVNGNKRNTYTLGKKNYQYLNGTKSLTKKASYQPYTSKTYKANMISYASLNTLVHTKCFQGEKAGTYHKAGYDGILCFSKYHQIVNLPKLKEKGWETAKDYTKINEFTQVKMVLTDENTTTAPNVENLKKSATCISSDLTYGLDYVWDTPDGPKDLYANIAYGTGEIELHYYTYIAKIENTTRSFGVGINKGFAKAPKNKNEGVATINTFSLAPGNIVECHIKFNLDLMNASIGAGKQSIGLIIDNTIDLGFLYIHTNVPTGVNFQFLQGLSGSDVTYRYKYAGGKPYAVDYFFTLETGNYDGSYTLSFPNDNATDLQTFIVDKKSIYQLTYTYGLKYSSGNEYKYQLVFALSGPQSSTITTNDRHSGKLISGSLKIEKMNK